MRESVSFLLLAEVIFTYAAERALEILVEILEFGAGSDSVIGIADCLVVNPTAYIAYVFVHFFTLLSKGLFYPLVFPVI